MAFWWISQYSPLSELPIAIEMGVEFAIGNILKCFTVGLRHLARLVVDLIQLETRLLSALLKPLLKLFIGMERISALFFPLKVGEKPVINFPFQEPIEHGLAASGKERSEGIHKLLCCEVD